MFPSEFVLKKEIVLSPNENAVIDTILIAHGIVDQERLEPQIAQPSVTDFNKRHAQYQPMH